MALQLACSRRNGRPEKSRNLPRTAQLKIVEDENLDPLMSYLASQNVILPLQQWQLFHINYPAQQFSK